MKTTRIDRRRVVDVDVEERVRLRLITGLCCDEGMFIDEAVIIARRLLNVLLQKERQHER